VKWVLTVHIPVKIKVEFDYHEDTDDKELDAMDRQALRVAKRFALKIQRLSIPEVSGTQIVMDDIENDGADVED
jgi:hypothetical protein